MPVNYSQLSSTCKAVWLLTFMSKDVHPKGIIAHVSNWLKLTDLMFPSGLVWANSLSFEASGYRNLVVFQSIKFKQSNLSLIAADWCNPSTVISQLSVPELYSFNCASMHHRNNLNSDSIFFGHCSMVCYTDQYVQSPASLKALKIFATTNSVAK